MTDSVKKFDLNIQKILEDWDVFHALREVIANAIDERLLTNTKEIEIYQDNDKKWHIRDYGRGLNYHHLTQNENKEKMDHPHTIGKFGIGLKDALATLHRHDIGVKIESCYGSYQVELNEKHGFEDITTLHVLFNQRKIKSKYIGTEFIFDGISKSDMNKAKRLFLKFSNDIVLDSTQFGQILKKQKKKAPIFINGVRVAEEEDFLFGYNITSLNKQIRKSLNRERTNVGRSAYSERVKSILLKSENKEVAALLCEDLQNYEEDTHHAELRWVDIQEHAVKILNLSDKKIAFFTPQDLVENPFMIEEAKQSGYKIIKIPEKLKTKIHNKVDYHGNQIMDVRHFIDAYNNSFEYDFVAIEDLSSEEKAIYSKKDEIIALIGKKPAIFNKVKISETLRKDLVNQIETIGCWDPVEGSIILRRDRLRSLEDFAGTLLHEVAHRTSGMGDLSLFFELELTEFIGRIVNKVLRKNFD